MKIPEWYDNFIEPCKELPRGIEIERTYCFEWTEFGEKERRILKSIYKKLPGNVKFCRHIRDIDKYVESDNEEGLPYWYGIDEDNPPFIWASQETPGLQVYGVISKEDWEAWDIMFRELIKVLPFRTY